MVGFKLNSLIWLWISSFLTLAASFGFGQATVKGRLINQNGTPLTNAVIIQHWKGVVNCAYGETYPDKTGIFLINLDSNCSDFWFEIASKEYYQMQIQNVNANGFVDLGIIPMYERTYVDSLLLLKHPDEHFNLLPPTFLLNEIKFRQKVIGDMFKKSGSGYELDYLWISLKDY